VIDERSRAIARKLTISYIVWSTIILAAAGLLGVILRWSQAVPQARVGDNFWYAMMTAHGLGAFVGWAGFAVMGLAWWVLAGVGFPVRGFGLVMARLTWWLMVLGVLGVIITTIFMGFGASWVFLYPLPFYGSGNWGAWATGLFSFSVLLAGLAIVTWCFGILHTVVNREALHSVSSSIGKRFGLSFGWGYLMPRTFATNPKPVPYPVIPLAVIGLDMIIATLPLAGLLIWQIFESMGVVGSANDLLAKNILWWFGHPVVYLLLFPAVAVYYWLIPRYAGRDLVAGHVIAVAWTVAVIANVFVWAHHLYLDYPSGTSQAQINTAMQPITFALVLPSALSLYSLGFTIYRSRFRWTPASTALFFGLVGWLLAGLSGIVNATIALDVAVHNTLWIVGHFHHMAMLNIGLLIFGAIYALLPELSGKALYSERMAWIHVWITFVVGMIFFGIWLVQGLDGAPRRWSVLPSDYDTLTRISLPFVFILAAAQGRGRDVRRTRHPRAVEGAEGILDAQHRGGGHDRRPGPRVHLRRRRVSRRSGVRIERRRHAGDDGGNRRRRQRCDHGRRSRRCRGVRELVLLQLPHARSRRRHGDCRPLARREEAVGGARHRTGDERHGRHARVPTAR
jgi:cytochrome c oxidase subunit 1